MDRVTYIFWEQQRHAQIRDYAEVFGLFTGTYEEADAALAHLNAHAPAGRGIRYYRTEPTVLTPAVLSDAAAAMSDW